MKTLPYKVTEEAGILNASYGITQDISFKLQSCWKAIMSSERPGTRLLEKYVRDYPAVPQFQNYLVNALIKRNQLEEAYRVNDRLLKQFPDYIFAKVHKAKQYIENKQYDTVKIILGPALELTALYPTRDQFHISEFMSYYTTVVDYYCQTDELEKAKNCVELMQYVNSKHDGYKIARDMLFHARMQKNAERLRIEREHERKVEAASYDVSIQTTEKPVFHFEEIWELYQYGVDLDTAILQRILLLPPLELIKDLEMALVDSMRRFEYFLEQDLKDDSTIEYLEFPVHAMYLLAELEAEQSLPVILDFLRQGEKFLQFWIGDMLTESLWEIIYKLGQNSLPLLESFICERSRFTYALAPIGSGLVQLVLHHPERQDEVLELYERVFDHYLAHLDDDDLIDSDKIGSFICDVIDIGGERLMPRITELFRHNVVASFVCGSLDEVQEEISATPVRSMENAVLSIFERYEYFTEQWIRFNEDEEDEYLDWLDDDERSMLPVRNAEEKIGRNDPCPCGSGKKYKKCCWDKT